MITVRLSDVTHTITIRPNETITFDDQEALAVLMSAAAKQAYHVYMNKNTVIDEDESDSDYEHNSSSLSSSSDDDDDDDDDDFTKEMRQQMIINNMKRVKPLNKRFRIDE